MLPFPVDMVGIVGCYGMLYVVHDAIEKSRTHSVFIRLFSSVISYCFAAFALDFLFNIVVASAEFFVDPGIGNFSVWIILMMCVGLMVRAYVQRSGRLRIDEIQNFILDGLLFRNYFRLRDVDIQEEIGTYRMKKIYTDVHGTEFNEDVIATAFDERPTTFKRISFNELSKKKKYYPLNFNEERKKLELREAADLSESFRLELMENTLHPFLSKIQTVMIDPVTREITIHLIFPSEKIISVQSLPERMRMTEKLYQALQVLIALEWFQLYCPFFDTIKATCLQRAFDDSVTETEYPFMVFEVLYHELQLRSSRITTAEQIQKIAHIRFIDSLNERIG